MIRKKIFHLRLRVHSHSPPALPPTGGEPLTLDMATSAVARGKVADSALWEQRLQPLLSSVTDSPRQSGVERIFLPGQPEHEREERAEQEGLVFSNAVETELRGLSEHYGVAFPRAV